MFKLVTHVKHLEDLKRADYSHFDEFYLGDYSCVNSESLSSDFASLREAVELLKAQSKKVYVSFPGLPMTADLEKIDRFMKQIADLPVDGVEFTSVGLVNRYAGTLPAGREVHFGIFGNIYTDITAKTLREMGVNRVFANPELSLDELCEIRDNAGVDVIFYAHGKLPLTPTVLCLFKQADPDYPCSSHRKDTSKTFVLKTDRWPEDHVLLCYGKMMVSGRDYCMIDHLEMMKSRGIGYFYINTINEPRQFIEETSRIYREALLGVFQNRNGFDPLAARKELEPLSPYGFANGFYFSRPGFSFVTRGGDIHD